MFIWGTSLIDWKRFVTTDYSTLLSENQQKFSGAVLFDPANLDVCFDNGFQFLVKRGNIT